VNRSRKDLRGPRASPRAFSLLGRCQQRLQQGDTALNFELPHFALAASRQPD
jgi:hypothetical protein